MANQQLNAKLVFCSVPTKNSDVAQKFYNTLFGGQDFARSLNDKHESHFRPINEDGLTLSIGTRNDEREPITCFFAVDDLNETVRQLEAVGGKIIVNSTEMRASGPPEALKAAQEVEPSTTWGQFVTMLDPDGNYFGLMQLADSAQSQFNARPAQRKLSKAQVDKQERWKQRGEPLMKKK
jgi:predicted enzyme related to lactoylglutathione lyase